DINYKQIMRMSAALISDLSLSQISLERCLAAAQETSRSLDAKPSCLSYADNMAAGLLWPVSPPTCGAGNYLVHSRGIFAAAAIGRIRSSAGAQNGQDVDSQYLRFRARRFLLAQAHIALAGWV